jgi:hypothetical protein
MKLEKKTFLCHYVDDELEKFSKAIHLICDNLNVIIKGTSQPTLYQVL